MPQRRRSVKKSLSPQNQKVPEIAVTAKKKKKKKLDCGKGPSTDLHLNCYSEESFNAREITLETFYLCIN